MVSSLRPIVRQQEALIFCSFEDFGYCIPVLNLIRQQPCTDLHMPTKLPLRHSYKLQNAHKLLRIIKTKMNITVKAVWKCSVRDFRQHTCGVLNKILIVENNVSGALKIFETLAVNLSACFRVGINRLTLIIGLYLARISACMTIWNCQQINYGKYGAGRC